MINTDVRQFSHNLNISVKEEVNWIKIGLKSTIPSLIAATIFRGLYEQSLIQPAGTVVYAASLLCESSQWIFVGAAAINMFYQFDKEENRIKQKEIEKQKIEEFEKLNQEVLVLSQENLVLKHQLQEACGMLNINYQNFKDDN